jgi:8-oxo-dGTP pyrophosphatase MutT (NUDIX family)
MRNNPNSNFISNIRTALDEHSRITSSEWEATPAAVLIPLFWHDDQWHLLYTRRTESVDSHRGQVSFPGGMIEETDKGPVEAALREVEEEIGIPAEMVEILGCVDSMFTITQFSITPVVGKIPWPVSMTLNTYEVARVFSVPVQWLADEKNLRTEEREVPGLGLLMPVHYFNAYDGEIIWGATARITLNFLEIIGFK